MVHLGATGCDICRRGAPAPAGVARETARQDNEPAAAAAAAVASRREAALGELAALRASSVEIERGRQEGLEALERARAEEAARKKAEAEAAEARRKAVAEAQRQAAAQAARERSEAAARKAAQDAARKAAASPTTSAPSPTPSQPGTSTPAPKGGVDAVVAFARAQLGEPYVWAADGPDSWDCSGLTMGAWAKAGVRLSHYTGSQYRQTSRVPIDDLRPGDLVFFGPSVAGIHHVGLFIGNGQMIHAPYTGSYVKITTIWRDDLIPSGGRP